MTSEEVFETAGQKCPGYCKMTLMGHSGKSLDDLNIERKVEDSGGQLMTFQRGSIILFGTVLSK